MGWMEEEILKKVTKPNQENRKKEELGVFGITKAKEYMCKLP